MLFGSKENITRNYDIAGNGFTPLPLKPPNQESPSDNQKFQWSIGLFKDLVAIFSAIFTAALGFGILMVIISMKLEANVKNEMLISLSCAMQISAGIFFARFLPRIGKKIGLVNSIYLGSIISAICALLLSHYFNYLTWISIIFCLGVSYFICGVTRNTIMIDLAPNHVRALIISIGTMLVAIGNGLGSVILSITKTSDSFISSLMACGFFLASMLPLARLKKVDGTIREEKDISIWRYIKNSPKIMFAGFAVSYAMSSSSAFLIIYGIKIGIAKDEASLLLSVLLFGTILYIPISYLTDILNRRFLMIFFGFLSLICSYLLYLNDGHQSIYTMLFLLFGCLSGIKLPAIVLINEKYKPTQRLAVNSAFAKLSLSGNLTGLFTTGAIMKSFGPNGLWISIMIILSIFLSFCSLNYLNKFLMIKIASKKIS